MRIAILGPASPREFAEALSVNAEVLPLGLGGTPVNELIRSLLNLGHVVHLVTTSPEIDEVHRFESDKLHISVVPLRTNLRNRAIDMFRQERRAMRSELRRVDVDVVHAHWTYEFALSAGGGKPTLVTAHDAPITILRLMPNAYRFIRLIMAYRVLFGTRNLSAVSPYLSTQLRKQMFYRRRILVIPNIVPELPPVTVSRSEELVIVDIATGAALKNVRCLVEAFALVRATIPSAELRLIGPGLGTDGQISRWAAREELNLGVQFLGSRGRSEIASTLAEATLFCHTSLEEAQPMSILEAMAARVPVIAGIDSGGVPWTLGEGAAGSLVDVTSSAAVASEILGLHLDSARRAEYIASGEKFIRSRFSSMAVGRSYVAEYSRIITEYSTKNRKGNNR